MKQPKLFFVLMLLLVRLGAYAENEVYTVFDQTKGEMTYYYDENRAANTALPNTIVEVYNPKLTRFKEYHDQIDKVFHEHVYNIGKSKILCGKYVIKSIQNKV